ncbi:MAG TPA: DUF5615 family PIN-like protein [Phycisphaerales bacterium]|nr:DUF5615 family PIN-like protein [Phycisphaerales bacterium]
MKVLLDENVPVELRHLLPVHEVFTVSYLGWKGIVNGRLLALAASNAFEVIVTKDAGIKDQQNLAALPVAVVYLQAKSNKIRDVLHLIPELIEVLQEIRPCTYVHIPRGADAAP